MKNRSKKSLGLIKIIRDIWPIILLLLLIFLIVYLAGK